MGYTSIDKIKEFIQEQKEKESINKEICNYSIDAMESKFEYDNIMLEALTLLTVSENKVTDEFKNKLEEVVNKMYNVVNEIYETLDLYPYLKGSNTINEVEYLTVDELFENAVQTLRDEMEIIMEACKRKKKLSKKKMKKKVKENLLTENLNNIDVVSAAFLSEMMSMLVDRIMFPSVNYYEVFESNKDEFIDKDVLNKLIEEYRTVRNSFVNMLISAI